MIRTKTKVFLSFELNCQHPTFMVTETKKKQCFNFEIEQNSSIKKKKKSELQLRSFLIESRFNMFAQKLRVQKSPKCSDLNLDSKMILNNLNILPRKTLNEVIDCVQSTKVVIK